MIYIRAMDHSLGALLAQNNDQGHEQAIYYLSRTMIGAEHRYNPIEKECLAAESPSLVWWEEVPCKISLNQMKDYSGLTL